jgi:hypothetical protein
LEQYVEPFDRAQGRQEEMEQHTKPLLPPALSSVEGLWSSLKRRCGNYGCRRVLRSTVFPGEEGYSGNRNSRNIFAMKGFLGVSASQAKRVVNLFVGLKGQVRMALR